MAVWLLKMFIQTEALSHAFPLPAKCPSLQSQEYVQVTHLFHLIKQTFFFHNSKHQNINGKIEDAPPSVQGSTQPPAEGPQVPALIFYRQRKGVMPDALKTLSPVTPETVRNSQLKLDKKECLMNKENNSAFPQSVLVDAPDFVLCLLWQEAQGPAQLRTQLNCRCGSGLHCTTRRNRISANAEMLCSLRKSVTAFQISRCPED